MAKTPCHHRQGRVDQRAYSVVAMSGEPDLAAAIAEVQAALERLRLAADRSATSAQGWDFVDPPVTALLSLAPLGFQG